jgi:ribulose-5-phosphate 4-epimerase/fuculose-1-phosphate aldolase
MDELGPIRREIADACRGMAARGLAEGVLGHVSVRIDEPVKRAHGVEDLTGPSAGGWV